ncbi:MAG: ATP-dependent sacrificial sulfur transferase LarE, partial [Desulfobulbaceae bacterium]|nr:ATP-dependent sacrificial sulfur transferase LarE [Desulfobulbaceae bacterium]
MSQQNNCEPENVGGLERKTKLLHQSLTALGRVAIAYSGGTDSSLLLAVARDTLGPGNVLALHNQTELQKPGEAQEAIGRAIQKGFELERDLLVINSGPLTRPDIVRNDSLRCYYCKKSLYSEFSTLATHRDFPYLLDGTNTDDLLEPRPGKEAIAELGVCTPLADVGFNKRDVRVLSRKLGLVTWNRPSGSCLATRIPNGIALRREDLHRVATLEEMVERLGFSGCRVKPESGNWKRVSVQIREEDFPSLLSIDKRKTLCHLLSIQGISEIFL